MHSPIITRRIQALAAFLCAQKHTYIYMCIQANCLACAIHYLYEQTLPHIHTHSSPIKLHTFVASCG